MPSSNGVYSLPVGYLAVTGATIQASQHNPPFEDVAAALTARLSRDGTAPMTGALQLASGSVGAPGGVFAADPSSGWYKTTLGIGLAISGQKVVEFTAAGIASGNRLIGELVPYVCTSAPNSLWVLPFGQTLSRTTYAVLWTQAQIEIAAGNTFFNNGDGSTTFGIGDMRDRVPAAWGKMGGSDAGRLTTAGGGIDGTTIGAVGGLQNQTLTLAQLPTGITSANASQAITVGPVGGSFIPVANATISSVSNAPAGGAEVLPNTGGSWSGVASLSGNSAISVTSNNTSGAAHPVVQPTLVTNYILFAGGAS